jgi:hypothetical protein
LPSPRRYDKKGRASRAALPESCSYRLKKSLLLIEHRNASPAVNAQPAVPALSVPPSFLDFASLRGTASKERTVLAVALVLFRSALRRRTFHPIADTFEELFFRVCHPALSVCRNKEECDRQKPLAPDINFLLSRWREATGDREETMPGIYPGCSVFRHPICKSMAKPLQSIEINRLSSGNCQIKNVANRLGRVAGFFPLSRQRRDASDDGRDRRYANSTEATRAPLHLLACQHAGFSAKDQDVL